jgi:hypothetical protein
MQNFNNELSPHDTFYFKIVSKRLDGNVIGKNFIWIIKAHDEIHRM